MAAVLAIVRALARSAWRSLRGVGSFSGNNFVVVIAFLMAEEPVDRPSSTAVFYLLIGLLYTIPLAQELGQRIPPDRLALWPLSTRQKLAIAAMNLALNPLLGIALLFSLLSRHPVVGAGLFVIGAAAPVLVAGFRMAGPSIRWSRLVPRIPGPLGGLMQNHLREFLQMLDFYLAALLAFVGVAYRLLATTPTDPAMPLVLGHMVVILVSTMAQVQPGFDAESGLTRYRLLPVTGRDLLLARDAAWLILVVVLTLGYPVIPCLSAALIALAAGHSSLSEKARPRVEQRRWNFSSGFLAPTGMTQIFGIVVCGALSAQYGWPVLVAAAGIYAGSVAWYGRVLD